MQIVIDIPKKKWETIQNGMYCGLLDGDLYQSIKHGIVRPTGHWIKHKNNAAGICLKISWECSVCRVWLGCEYFVRRSYCPNCGARMIKPQESEEQK